jgi:DUF971 family protein
MDAMPVEVRRVEEREIHVRWADGHRSVFPNVGLRRACPCAQCVHELTGARLLDPASVPADVRAEAIALVGRYAMRVRWSDGHDTGIFTWQGLRDACPCASCEADRRAPPPATRGSVQDPGTEGRGAGGDGG